LRGQHPGQREKVVLAGKLLAHSHQAQPQKVLPCEYVNAWVVIDLLEEVHAKKNLRQNCAIGPEHIPIACVGLRLYFPFKLFCDFADDWILGV